MKKHPTTGQKITQPADWWEAFRDEAARQGRSLSEWMGAAAKEQLPPRTAKRLSKRPAANRPKSTS